MARPDGFSTAGLDQQYRVSRAVARMIPHGTWAGIFKANVDGSIPNLDFYWMGSDFTDQWGLGSTPQVPDPNGVERFNAPQPVDHLEILDYNGDVVHDFGAQTPVANAIFTVPGTIFQDSSGWRYGGYTIRCRLNSGSPNVDTNFGVDQGGSLFAIVPDWDEAICVYPDPATTGTAGRYGELNPASYSLYGTGTRAYINLHKVESGSVLPASTFTAGNQAVANLETQFRIPFLNPTRSDGVKDRLRLCSAPDFVVGDKALLKAEISKAAYDLFDVFMGTNEILPDGGHEGGILGPENVAQQKEFWQAVTEARPTKLVGSASSTRITAADVTRINAYLAAARADSGSYDEVYFDVLSIHDYPGSNGTPGYAEQYYANLADLDWDGPIIIDESVGAYGQLHGAGTPKFQLQTGMWESRCLQRAGITPGRTYEFPGFEKFPWSVEAYGTMPYGHARITRRLMLRDAIAKTPESILTWGVEDQLWCGGVYRLNDGTGVVDVQTLGDPNASLTLALTGTPGSTVHVVNAFGRRTALPVTSGRITIAPDDLYEASMMDGCYVLLPSGCSATVVLPYDASKVMSGFDLSVTCSEPSKGTTRIRSILDDDLWPNSLARNDSEDEGPYSPWQPDTLLHAATNDSQWIKFGFHGDTKRLQRLITVFQAPWQARGFPTKFVLETLVGSTATSRYTFDLDPASKVLEWVSDLSTWRAFYTNYVNNHFVHRIVLPGGGVVCDGFRYTVTGTTYGMAPTKAALTGFGRVTVDTGDGPIDPELWQGGNVLGAGFGGGPRWGFQHLSVVADSGTGIHVPEGPVRYLIRGTGTAPSGG
jgi:hypothetical protein